jgi:hypothetical protein
MRQFTGILLFAVCTLLPPLAVTGKDLRSLHARISNDVQRRDTNGSSLVSVTNPSSMLPCLRGWTECRGAQVWWGVNSCVPLETQCCSSLSNSFQLLVSIVANILQMLITAQQSKCFRLLKFQQSEA